MYVKDTFRFTTSIDTYNKLKIPSVNIELENNTKFKVSGVYRCHSIEKDEFIDSLKVFLDVNKNCKNHCIAGDFNIDLLVSNEQRDDYLYSLFEHMYLPSFHNITRLDNRMVNGGSCIDNIFLKSNNVNSYACKFLNPITDHYPLYLIIKLSNPACSIAINSKKLINYNKINVNCQK